MRIKIVLTIIMTFLLTSLNAQKKYEVLKIDTGTIETMNVVYLKKNTLFGHKIYRIMTYKKDTTIVGKEKIKVGDYLKLKLVPSKLDIGLTSTPEPSDNKNSFFYKDNYDGKKVHSDYYTDDLIDLYPARNND